MPFLAFLRGNAKFLFAGFLLALLSSFGQTFFISIFAAEIRAEFGLSHGDWGGIYGLATTVSAAVMLWAGGLTDRFRVRRLGAWVLAGLALACLAMALNPFAGTLVGVIFLLRFFGQGMVSHVSGIAMARWFVASRGRALAIAALGYSVGEATLPILFVALKQAIHWRTLWFGSALLIVAAMPLLIWLLKLERTPQSMASESQSLGMGDRHWTRGQALRHPLFWSAFPMLLAPAAFNTAFFFHQVHLAEVKGWGHAALVTLFPVYSLATIAAMMASGWAVDRFGTARLMPIYQLPLAAFYLLFAGIDGLGAAATAIILMGMTSGAQSTVPVAFWAEFYGTRHIGAIKATAAAVMVLGSAIGPIVTGALIDRGHDFPAQMWAIAAYIAAASALVGAGIALTRKETESSAKTR
ncbi:MFS transporter [Aliigemmobacter aestuarii]|uniref:MFS transporter n=1 Tax=Aliigemmobacter aestuarii TaxID=1445661 RepID=A0A4S3MQW2_9RHOB|nr:MFS transporter [Gemmobacter aestuarii]THD84484.1 MFS transporter [Gemmobacter aestuarii]